MSVYSLMVSSGSGPEMCKAGCVYQVRKMKGIEIRLFLIGRIMIPIRLCSLPIHSPGICLLGPNE